MGDGLPKPCDFQRRATAETCRRPVGAAWTALACGSTGAEDLDHAHFELPELRISWLRSFDDSSARRKGAEGPCLGSKLSACDPQLGLLGFQSVHESSTVQL